jgi:hypothetical protein
LAIDEEIPAAWNGDDAAIFAQPEAEARAQPIDKFEMPGEQIDVDMPQLAPFDVF